MSNTNRATLLTKLHKALRQHYKPFPLDERPLIEQLLFAACLENSTRDIAESAYNTLRQTYYDWNEVRVSTVIELAELLKVLPHPAVAAANIKRILQDIFETTYSFDLEVLKKQNIGAGIQRLEKSGGTTSFIVAYVTQHSLEGHSIPLDRAALALLRIVGVIDEAEEAAGKVTGLERTIPKNKGLEFGCLLHQAAAELYQNVNSPTVKKALTAVSSHLKDHWPKRSPKKEFELAEKAKEEAARKLAEEQEKARQEALRVEAQAKKEAADRAVQAKAAKAAKAEAARLAKLEAAKPKPETHKPSDKSKSRAAEAKHEKKPPAKHPAKPQPKAKSKPAASKSASSKGAKSHVAAKKKSTTKQLAKRKPR